MLGMVSVHAPPPPPLEQANRVGIDLVAVIDRSGSMRGNKLKLTRQSLTFITRHLRQCDRLAVVTYDTLCSTVLPLTYMDQAGKLAAISTIDRISAGSQTNLSGGLIKGLTELSSRADHSDRPATVLLLTDGEANQGITDQKMLLDAMQSCSAGIQSPCSIYTFGYGEQHNDTLLKEMAEVGRGMYYFVQAEETIPESFADCLGGLMSVGAQNVRVKLLAVGGASIGTIRGKPTMQRISAEEVVLELNDLYCEEQRDVLITMELPALSEPAVGWEVLSAELEYFNVIDNSMERASATLRLHRPHCLAAEHKCTNKTVDANLARVQTADALDRADQAAQQGLFEGPNSACKVIDDALARLSELVDSGSTTFEFLSADLRIARAGILDQHQYRAWGSKKCKQSCSKNYKQRSNDSSRNMYQTTRQLDMKAAVRGLTQQPQPTNPSMSVGTTWSVMSIHPQWDFNMLRVRDARNRVIFEIPGRSFGNFEITVDLAGSDSQRWLLTAQTKQRLQEMFKAISPPMSEQLYIVKVWDGSLTLCSAPTSHRHVPCDEGSPAKKLRLDADDSTSQCNSQVESNCTAASIGRHVDKIALSSEPGTTASAEP